jgi:RNA polymerase sigma-70 factor (ECF subfamily)
MDRELIKRAQHGDETAFEALTVSVHPRLFRLAQGILRDPALAEEATQQAFIDAWRFLRRLPDPERFLGWSYRLVIDACSEELQRQSSEETADAGPADVSVPTAGPFEIAIDRAGLARGFSRLPVEDRAVIVMRCQLDLAVAEIAELLSLGEAEVASRISAALTTLGASIEAGGRSRSAAPEASGA